MNKLSNTLAAGGLLAACMAMPARAVTYNVTVSNVAQLNAAFDAAEGKPADNYVVTVTSGSYLLTKTLTLTKGRVELKGSITLPSSHNIDASAIKRRAFTLKAASSAYSPHLLLNGVTVKNGYEDFNGGGCVWAEGMTSTLIVSNSVIENCKSNLPGSGIYAANSRVTLLRSVLRNNVNLQFGIGGGGVTSSGGGLGAYGTSIVQIYRSTFYGNKATRAGAIMINGTSTLLLDNSTISGNTAYRGAGLMIVGTGAVRIQFSTITKNIAGPDYNSSEPRVGGGILFADYGGILNFTGNIVAGNDTKYPDPQRYATQGDDCFAINTSIAGRWSEARYYTNLIGILDASCVDKISYSQAGYVGWQNSPYDPKLGVLSNMTTGYGPVLPVHRPTATSPARSAFHKDYGYGNGSGSCPTQDQLSKNRLGAPGLCDIGAVEATSN